MAHASSSKDSDRPSDAANIARTVAALELRAEAELLLLCARSDAASFTSRIRELSTPGAWHYVGESAMRHRVVPQVYRSLLQLGPDVVPPALVEAFASRCATNLARNLYMTGELKKLVMGLEASGIRALPYKGLMVALTVYGHIGAREFGDLDILVRPRDYQAACDYLRDAGYVPGDDWGWESSWQHPGGIISVDLHRAVTSSQFPLPVDFDRLYGRRQNGPGPLAGIGSPGVVDTLLLLCVDIAKDAASRGDVRLGKLCDIAELLRTRPDIDWRTVRDEARRLRCERVVALGLLASHTLLGTPRPKDALDGLGADGLTLLRHLRVKLFPNDVNQAWRLSSTRFHFHARERWRDKLHPHYRAVKRAVQPGRSDRAAVARLPVGLQFLAYVIRPFRLLLDAGSRSRRRVDDAGSKKTVD